LTGEVPIYRATIYPSPYFPPITALAGNRIPIGLGDVCTSVDRQEFGVKCGSMKRWLKPFVPVRLRRWFRGIFTHQIIVTERYGCHMLSGSFGTLRPMLKLPYVVGNQVRLKARKTARRQLIRAIFG
jgi:hypothetical protein